MAPESGSGPVPLAIRIASTPGVSCAGAVRTAIACGGDTDTIAAMAAQIVGAAGLAPPDELVDRVQDAAQARALFSRIALLNRSVGQSRRYLIIYAPRSPRCNKCALTPLAAYGAAEQPTVEGYGYRRS